MDEAQMEKEQSEGPKGDVQFGASCSIALGGIVGGVLIALGLPWLLLAYGQSLGTVVVTILLFGALFTGGLVAVVSTFFGLVMPKVVRGHWRGPWPRHRWGCAPGQWKESEDSTDHAEPASWAEPDWQNWGPQDGRPGARR